MPNENDPKEVPTRDSIIDSAAKSVEEKFSGNEMETDNPENGQLENQAEVTPEAGGEPAQETPTDETPGNDKGFANHPAWVEREAKLKEAQGKLKESEAKQKFLDSLLDDPRNYERYLRSQGFSTEEIARAMSGRGFASESKPGGLDNQTKRSMAEAACEKLGWNINALTPEQKAYINDHVALTEQVVHQILTETLDKRLAPLEKNEAQRALDRDTELGLEASKKLAAEEFPGMDWDKEILPAIGKYLDELDRRDPKGTIRMTPEQVYEKATRPLLLEKRVRDSRQAERNENKRNARPLAPGIQTNASQGAKPKTWKDRVEQAIASR